MKILLRKALGFLRLMPVSEHNEVSAMNDKTRFENVSLRQELDELRAFKAERLFIIDAFIEAPEPSGEGDRSKRRDYMGRVAGFHADILRPRLRHMISNSLCMFEDEEVVGEKQYLIKGAIFAFRELMLWGDKCVSEHISTAADEIANKPNKPLP